MKRARKPGYKYFSVFIEDLGADKVKTLVFLKKIFEDGSFADTKERAQNLPLCLFSGIEELALPLTNSPRSELNFTRGRSLLANLSRGVVKRANFKILTPAMAKFKI